MRFIKQCNIISYKYIVTYIVAKILNMKIYVFSSIKKRGKEKSKFVKNLIFFTMVPVIVFLILFIVSYIAYAFNYYMNI